MLRRFLYLILIGWLGVPALIVQAQDASLGLTSQRQPVVVNTGVAYQSYSDDNLEVSQLSIPLFVYAPIGRQFSATVQVSQATTETNIGLTDQLSGLTNVNLGANYVRTFGKNSLVMTLNVSLPSGKSDLSLREFQTAVLASRSFYGLRVPGLGQGLSISPGLTLARPITDDLVFGIGLKYGYKGGYKPLALIDGEYDPGDELLVTAGADYRLSETGALSGDVTVTFYGNDKVGDLNEYESGTRFSAVALFQQFFNYDQLRILARFSTRAKTTLPADGNRPEQIGRAIPTLYQVQGQYFLRFSQELTLGTMLELRFFGSTPVFTSKTNTRLGLLPSYQFSPKVTTNARLLATLGSVPGYEVGLGLVLRL